MARKRSNDISLPTTDTEIRAAILQAAAKNLREFGYKNATASDVLTFRIYRLFFASMLKDDENQGKGHGEQFDRVRRALLDECVALGEKDGK